MNSEVESIDRHNREIQENLKRWDEKELLRSEYRRFYQEISREIRPQISGKIVELGSGIGRIREIIPDCILTDLFKNPWIDQQESAYRLSFSDQSVSHLILFDVFHHLQYPGDALEEFHRVLSPGGRLILFEPAAGVLGRIIYGLFHPEPLALNQMITWKANDSKSLSESGYYAAQGNAWRIFRQKEFSNERASLWTDVRVQTWSALAYLLCGGFSRPQVIPTDFQSFVHKIEFLLDWIPTLTASRMLIVLEKKSLQ